MLHRYRQRSIGFEAKREIVFLFLEVKEDAAKGEENSWNEGQVCNVTYLALKNHREPTNT